jgi:hypothetical protein
MRDRMIAIIGALALTAAAALSAPAVANTISASKSTVQKDCAAVKGKFSSHGITYQCVKGNNSVMCTAGICIGTCPKCPARTVGIKEILHPPYAGVKSSDANAPPTGRRHPVTIGGFKPLHAGNKLSGSNNQPVVYMHTEHRFGNHR